METSPPTLYSTNTSPTRLHPHLRLVRLLLPEPPLRLDHLMPPSWLVCLLVKQSAPTM